MFFVIQQQTEATEIKGLISELEQKLVPEAASRELIEKEKADRKFKLEN